MELILVTPILLLLFGGIVDFGFVFQSYEVVTNAAREGARLGSLPAYNLNPNDIVGRVNDYISQSGVRGSAGSAGCAAPCWYTTVTQNVAIPSVNASGVQVDVIYEHQFLLLRTFAALSGNTLPSGLTLRARSIMRYELQPAATGS